MSPLLLEVCLTEKYGPRLTLQEFSDVLKVNPKTLLNKLALNKIQIPLYNDSGRFVLASDVSQYICCYSEKFKSLLD